MRLRLLLAAGLMIAGQGAGATVITVGPAGQFSSIGAAVNFANADATPDTIQVAAGTYQNDFAVVSQPVTIEAVGGPVILSATVPPPNLKGIITTTSSLTVDGLTFQGAAISNSDGGNGAGIRDQSPGAASLIVMNSKFIGNQDGILTAGSGNQETVQILNSQFINNGNPSDPGGQEHALYVGDALSLLVSGSLFCGTAIGHDIKSRAASTTVTGSQIFIGTNSGAPAGCDVGSTSFGIDITQGGQASISGTQLFQGDANQNGAMVSYGEDGLTFAVNSFVVSDTTFANLGTRNSVGIQELAGGAPTCLVPVQLSNTTIQNVTTPVNPPGCSTSVTPPTPSQVPEPQSLWLVLTALGCCIGVFGARRAV
jgi:hypothetical protein